MQKLIPSIIFFFALTVVASADTYQAQKFPPGTDNTQRCLKCHGMYNFTYLDSSKTLINLSVDSTVFFSSVHGKLQCQACRTRITDYPLTNNIEAKWMRQDATLMLNHYIRKSQALQCQQCHAPVGKGIMPFEGLGYPPARVKDLRNLPELKFVLPLEKAEQLRNAKVTAK